MTRQEAKAALDVGAEVARELVASGARCLITGDMGIGNTTPSAALIAYFTGRPAGDVVGRGTGIDDAMFTHKTAVVEAALARTARDVAPDDPLGALASLGGLEIAALAGYIVGAGAAGVPVLIDGVIAAAALLVAAALLPRSPSATASPAIVRPSRARGPRSNSSACGHCCDSTCASARAPGPAWPSRWCRPPPASSTRCRPSTRPA